MSEAGTAPGPVPQASVLFCGEQYDVSAGTTFTIGRDADLVVDENPFLHRRLLSLEHSGGLWWLTNSGSRLSATVSDTDGLLQSWLAPGAAVPLVLPRTVVLFTAGATTYEVEVQVSSSYVPTGSLRQPDGGTTTLAPPVLTDSQYLLVLALAEPLLRQGGRGRTELPSSADAARRLGWQMTRFNRKLDNVCQKLARSGVRGLHGGPGVLASGRRARLVEYAVTSRLVSRDSLYLLEGTAAPAGAGDQPSQAPDQHVSAQ